MRDARPGKDAVRWVGFGGVVALAAAWLMVSGQLPDGPRPTRASPPRPQAQAADVAGEQAAPAPVGPAAGGSPAAPSSDSVCAPTPALVPVVVAACVDLDDRLEARRAGVLARLAACTQARLEVTWREDDPGVPDAVVLEDAPGRAGEPRAVASLVMRDLAAALGGGWAVADASAAPRALVPGDPIEADPGSVLVPFDPHLEGLPVQHGRLTLELARRPDGLAPKRLVGRWDPAPSVTGRVRPEVEAALAAAPAPALEGGVTPLAASRLVAAPVPGGPCRRAFVVDRAAPDGSDTRRLTVDAETGATLADDSIQCAGVCRGLVYARDPGATPRSVATLPGLYVVQGKGRATTDAVGRHPFSGAVSLPQGLAGPLLRVVPAQGAALSYVGPADFTLTPAEATSAQDQLAAFWHLQTYDAAVRAAFPALRPPARRFAVVVGAADANAFFIPGAVRVGGEPFDGRLVFGAISGKSTARDADVTRHEYTHALLDGCATLYGSSEALGLNEGLADYLPCALKEAPLVGAWITPPFLRALDGRDGLRVYPADAQGGEPHRVGVIVDQALWEVRAAAERRVRGGRLEFDRAVVGGVLRLPPRPSLLQARDAFVAADRAQNAGANAELIVARFAAHGIGATPAPKPATASDGTGLPVLAAVTRTVRAGAPLTITWSVSGSAGPPELTLGKTTFACPIQPVRSAAGATTTLSLTLLPGPADLGDRVLLVVVRAGALQAALKAEIKVTR